MFPQAGLLSAILTTFIVQSYQLLQPAPADQTNAILTQVSAQLSGFSVTPLAMNSTRPAFDSPPPFRAPLYAIWLNALWFASLVFSIASASIGIMVKQWLKEYKMGLYGNSREVARRRQHRLNNLQKWQVAAIVALLPILLQISLFLFLAGLVVFVRSIHPTVALVVLILVTLLLAFQFGTTALPAIYSSCCYYSPQAYAAFLVRKAIQQLVLATYLLFSCSFVLVVRIITCVFDSLTWMYWAQAMDDFAYRCTFCAMDVANRKWRVIWKGHEEDEATKSSMQLDSDMMLAAYKASRDARRCFEVAEVCLVDTEDWESADRYIREMSDLLSHRWVASEHWPLEIRRGYYKLLGSVLHSKLLATWMDPDLRKGAQKRIIETFGTWQYDEITGTMAAFDISVSLCLISMDDGDVQVSHRAWLLLRHWFRVRAGSHSSDQCRAGSSISTLC